MALGKSDYGLLGVVGGLAAFISYFNSILAGSYGRFFAVAVGESASNEHAGISQGQKWFATAMLIQFIVPTLLMVVGYPIGEWAVRNFLTIPADRIMTCVWVWRFVAISCYVGMVTIPLNAMYAAHQYIAELTIYSFATTTFNACFLYYIVNHPGAWLSRVAFWQCLMAVLPNIIIAIRALYLFPECRFCRCSFAEGIANLKQLASYAFWNAWGAFGATLREQGMAIMVNKYFGPVVNAGIAVGSNLSGQCNTLSGSIQTAFSPAIYNSWGEKDYDKARTLSFMTCKYGALFILIFAIPLVLEVDEVLALWLGDPPVWAAEMCVCVLVSMLIDRLSAGHLICVCARGKLAAYQGVLGTIVVLTLPLAWLLVLCGFNVWSVGIAMIVAMTFCSIGRVMFAHGLVGMSARYWLRSVFAPIVLVSGVASVAAVVPQLFMEASFLRIVLTTAVCEGVLCVSSWYLLLEENERQYVCQRLCKRKA